MIQLLRKRIGDLETTVSDSKKREEKYKETTEHVIKSSIDIANKYTTCTEKFEKLKPEYDKLSKKVGGLDTGIKNMSLKMIEHKKRSRELQRQSDSLGSKLLIERAKNEECNKSVIDFVAARDSDTKLISDYETKIFQSEELLNKYRLEKDRLQSKFGDVMNQIATLTLQNQENDTELQRCDELEEHFGDAMNRIADLELHIRELATKYKQQLGEFANAKFEKDEIELAYRRDIKRLAEAEMEKTELQQAKLEIEKKYAKLASETGIIDVKRLAEVEIQKTDLEEKYSANLKRLNDCVSRAGRLQQEYQDMSEDLEVCNDDSSKLRIELQAFKANKENLEAMVADHKKNIDALREKDTERGLDIQILYNENATLIKQLGELTSKNASILEKKKELQDSILYLQIEKEEGVGCDDINREFERYKSEVETAMREHNQQIETLRASNQNCDNRVKDLNDKIRALETELSLKKEERTIDYVVQPDIETQEINENLRRDIKVLENTIQELNRKNEILAERELKSSNEYLESNERLEQLILDQENIIAQLESQITELKASQEEDVKEGETDKDQCYRLASVNSALTESISELQRELDQTNDDFRDQHQEYVRNNATLRTRISDLEKENEIMSENDEECERMSAKSSESERYERMSDELALENESLREENEKLKEMLQCTVENDSHCQQRMVECMEKSRGELLEA